MTTIVGAIYSHHLAIPYLATWGSIAPGVERHWELGLFTGVLISWAEVWMVKKRQGVRALSPHSGCFSICILVCTFVLLYSHTRYTSSVGA